MAGISADRSTRKMLSFGQGNLDQKPPRVRPQATRSFRHGNPPQSSIGFFSPRGKAGLGQFSDQHFAMSEQFSSTLKPSLLRPNDHHLDGASFQMHATYRIALLPFKKPPVSSEFGQNAAPGQKYQHVAQKYQHANNTARGVGLS